MPIFFFSSRGLRTFSAKRVLAALRANKGLCLTYGFFLLLGLSGLSIRYYFGECPLEQVLFHIVTPLDPADTGLIELILHSVGWVLLLWVVLFMMGLALFGASARLRQRKKIVVTMVGLAGVIAFAQAFSDYDFVWNRLTASEGDPDFYQNHYTLVRPAEVRFAQKRNLVVVYLESLEATFGDRRVFPSSLLPHLSALRDANASVADAYQSYGMTWTAAGLVSSLCGIPLRTSMWSSMSAHKDFLPGAVSLTDILAANGYDLRFLQGTRLTFAGHDKFLLGHGLQREQCLDYTRLVEMRPELAATMGVEDWSLPDSVLYSTAQKEMTNMHGSGKPFALFLMSMNTHLPVGYLEPGWRNPRPRVFPPAEQAFADVVLCADDMAANFVNWIVAQPFGTDTLVVVLSDHLAMRNPLASALYAHEALRRNLNIWVNPAKPLSTVGRSMTYLDVTPTVLEALGANLPDGRFGLGVSLYSGKPTLMESEGMAGLKKALAGYSPFYNTLAVAPRTEN